MYQLEFNQPQGAFRKWDFTWKK